MQSVEIGQSIEGRIDTNSLKSNGYDDSGQIIKEIAKKNGISTFSDSVSFAIHKHKKKIKYF